MRDEDYHIISVRSARDGERRKYQGLYSGKIRVMRERGEDRTDWAKVNSMSDEEIEAAISSDPDEAGIEWDWDSANLVMPEPKEP
jgi:hypothetical protein